jgi:hypothetical protein
MEWAIGIDFIEKDYLDGQTLFSHLARKSFLSTDASGTDTQTQNAISPVFQNLSWIFGPQSWNQIDKGTREISCASRTLAGMFS